MKYSGFFIENDGRISTIPEDVHLKYILRSLILTRKGERILYPEIGEGIENFLFRNIYPGLLDEVKLKVESVIKKNEPRITLLETKVVQSSKEKFGLDIYLKYKIKNSNKIESLNLNMIQ